MGLPQLTRNKSNLQPLPPRRNVDIPERPIFRFKERVLGKALTNDQMAHERLGKPTALAVFSSDNLSSSAYATEEILRTLLGVGAIGGVGLLAFNYVVPITVAMLLVLAILVLSYRQTIKAYPSAGGAYIVTKDNLGILPAQIAGVALLTDYILTVAVSVSAGVAALYSVSNVLYPYRVLIAVVFIAIIAWGNLRGVKESGKIFAVPTYMFLVSMFVLIGVGLFRQAFGGGLEHVPLETEQVEVLAQTGTVSIFLLLHAFASGGAAVTGVEAISNGVPAFKKPEAKNARETLVLMGSLLGFMFLGISWMAAKMHVVPTESKTVLSQIAEGVYGTHGIGHVLFLVTQASTMLILVLAANTSYADFPRLAAFAADDAFMPKQLTKRGHRLVYSNGIVMLSVFAGALVILLGADVSKLIPLYAIGVFTSFTLSQLGMAKRHIRVRERHWQLGLFINGLGAIMTAVVTVVVGVTKFTHGAWVIMLLVPILVVLLFRLNTTYESEQAELEHEAVAAASQSILRNHTVLVLIGRLDRPAARAIQYARSLTPDELKAVHIATDRAAAAALADEWARLGLTRLPLEMVDCPDRRLNRVALEVVAEAAADGDTEVTVLIPRREYRRFWHRFLHDRTSDSLADLLAEVPHANVTFVPYHLGSTAVPDEVLVARKAASLAGTHTKKSGNTDDRGAKG